MMEDYDGGYDLEDLRHHTHDLNDSEPCANCSRPTCDQCAGRDDNDGRIWCKHPDCIDAHDCSAWERQEEAKNR